MKITLSEIQNILKNQNPEYTEELAQKAARLTRQFFGRTISLYAPLYLSNYCQSQCSYCGFNRNNPITRKKLTEKQMHQEMEKIAQSRIENILLLTGESPRETPLTYLKKAVKIAKEYFSCIHLEVYPLSTEDYHQLYRSGVDGVTIYQETYDRQRYQELHQGGQKKDYDFRMTTPERIAQSGIRCVSMGVLLGLTDISADLFSLYQHLRWMENHYPGVEYSLSFPRLQKIKGQVFSFHPIDDITFIKIICLTRIQFPRIGINLSTRESPFIRNHTLELGITRISAGSNTSVGGYCQIEPSQQDPQFDIVDQRSVQDIIELLKIRQFDPILTDWRPIENI